MRQQWAIIGASNLSLSAYPLLQYIISFKSKALMQELPESKLTEDTANLLLDEVVSHIPKATDSKACSSH